MRRGCLLPAVRGACPCVWDLGAEGGGEGEFTDTYEVLELFLKASDRRFARNTAAVRGACDEFLPYQGRQSDCRRLLETAQN